MLAQLPIEADRAELARDVAFVLPEIERCGVGFASASRLTFDLSTAKAGFASARCDWT